MTRNIVVCTAVALALMIGLYFMFPVSTLAHTRSFAPAYHPPTDRLQLLYDLHDGQAFASLAMDPTLARPDGWQKGRVNLAYRAARPLVGWIGWAGSMGRPWAVQWVLAALSIFSIGLLAYVTTRCAHLMGKKANLAWMVLLVPGAAVTVVYPGLSDALGAALGLFGVSLWLGGRRAVAVVLLCLAALSRETYVLLAAGLVIEEVWRTRRIRPVLPLALPALLYAGWVTIVHARVGAWPSDYSGNLSAPFFGLAGAIGRGWAVSAIVSFAVSAVLIIAALKKRPCRLIRIYFVLFGILAALGGADVWRTWESGMPRALMPIQIMALLVLLPDRRPVQHAARTQPIGSPSVSAS